MHHKRNASSRESAAALSPYVFKFTEVISESTGDLLLLVEQYTAAGHLVALSVADPRDYEEKSR